VADLRPTSLSLLERVRGRDSDAWGRLVTLYGPLVGFWCKAWGVRGADADDVRQEVFSAVAAGLAQFRRDRPDDTFRGWLRGITRNKLLDHVRRRKRSPEALGGTDAQLLLGQCPDPDAELPAEPGEELSGLFHRALELVRAEFEPRTWDAFWRVAVDGRPASAVADELAMAAPAVRMAKSRVLRRLRQEVGDLID
jgi:RNA polymerase sigma-70 factor (ECF subfamily)